MITIMIIIIKKNVNTDNNKVAFQLMMSQVQCQSVAHARQEHRMMQSRCRLDVQNAKYAHLAPKFARQRC